MSDKPTKTGNDTGVEMLKKIESWPEEIAKGLTGLSAAERRRIREEEAIDDTGVEHQHSEPECEQCSFLLKPTLYSWFCPNSRCSLYGKRVED